MKAKPVRVKTLALSLLGEGYSTAEVAAELHLPEGTVKTWKHRAKGDMKPAMKPAFAKNGVAAMKPAMKPAEGSRFETCRGLTYRDLPGRSEIDQRANFYAMKRGLYPPKCAKIPSFLEGRELLTALSDWVAKKRNTSRVGGRVENDE